MSTDTIRFTDGAAYEQYMGKWSRLAGESFLAWLAPKPDLRWLDVGCGNGAFTEMLAERCAPAAIHGIDPSEEQLTFARSRPPLRTARFQPGNAMALPYGADEFDVAVMPLVIFFVPVPAKGVAEMARVVAPGGIVAAYSWDLLGGGFPYAAVHEEMRALGSLAPLAPNPDAARFDSLRQFWTDAGLTGLETKEITVERTYGGFDEFWTIVLGGPSTGPKLAAMSPADKETLKTRLRARLPMDAVGRITYSARANAIKGYVPK